MSKAPKYVSAYSSGPAALHSTARARNATGQSLVELSAALRVDLENYKRQYGRSGTKTLGTLGSEAALDGLAKKVFAGYIKVKIAEQEHGAAVAAAPATNEMSQAVVEEEEPTWFGFSSTTTTSQVAMTLTVPEERQVNAIVRDHAAIAAEYGLTEGGSNSGPVIDMAAAKAKAATVGGRRRRNVSRKNRKGKDRKSRKNRKQSRRNRH